MAVRSSAQVKLHWAETHLSQLYSEMLVFENVQPYRIMYERDPSRSRYVFRVKDLNSPPAHWALLVGDCIHNLRSSLDHLAQSLAVLAQGTLTPEKARSVSFPIFRRKKRFEDKNRGGGRQKIRLLRPTDQARIEELQPYNAGNAAVWGDMFGDDLPHYLPLHLDFIEEFDNIDKHRLLQFVWHGLGKARHPSLAGQQVDVTARAGVLYDDAEIGYWQFAELPEELPRGIDVHSSFEIEPQLENPFFPPTATVTAFPDPTLSVYRVLSMAVGAVQGVLRLFEPAVNQGADPLACHELVPVEWRTNSPSRRGTSDS